MNIALWVVQILLLGMFGISGVMKALMTTRAKDQLPWAKDRSDGLLHFVGIAEILGALGMVLPLVTGILPWLMVLAAVGLAIIQVLAIFTVHIPRKEFKGLPMNVVLLLLAIFVAWGRWGLFVK